MPRVRVSTVGTKFKLRGRVWAHVVVTNTRGELWRPVLVFRSLWFWLLTWWEFFRLVDLQKPLFNRFMFVFSLVLYHIRAEYSVEREILGALQYSVWLATYFTFVGKLVDTSRKSQYRILI